MLRGTRREPVGPLARRGSVIRARLLLEAQIEVCSSRRRRGGASAPLSGGEPPSVRSRRHRLRVSRTEADPTPRQRCDKDPARGVGRFGGSERGVDPAQSEFEYSSFWRSRSRCAPPEGGEEAHLLLCLEENPLGERLGTPEASPSGHVRISRRAYARHSARRPVHARDTGIPVTPDGITAHPSASADALGALSVARVPLLSC